MPSTSQSHQPAVANERKPSALKRVGRFLWRDTIVAPTVGLLGVAAIGGIIYAEWQWAEAQDAPYTSQAPVIEKYLNDHYAEQITYVRKRESTPDHSRHTQLAEHLYV